MLYDDQEIFSLIDKEKQRQRNTLSMIASENITSNQVMLAVGSILTNKYAEGYPDKRYYAGCEFHDEIENTAINRAKKLFQTEHANVQPHCGSNANMAALFSVAQMGDTILAMNLDHGGHLTHGSSVNFSGRWFNIVSYGVRRDDELIDYDALSSLAQQHKPKLIIAGASAYSRVIDFAYFHKIARDCGAYLMVDMAHIAGLVAACVHPSPALYADIITSTTHKSLRGPRGGLILSKLEFKKNIDSWIFPGLQGGPLMHEIAGKAICFKEAMTKEFISYQHQVVKNASRLAKVIAEEGLRLVAKGTDTHLLLIDVTNLNLTGKDAEHALLEVGIIANKNKVPYDDKPPTITSGLRLGTPSLTTRGMKENEMDEIGSIIVSCLKKTISKSSLQERVSILANRFTM